MDARALLQVDGTYLRTQSPSLRACVVVAWLSTAWLLLVQWGFYYCTVVPSERWLTLGAVKFTLPIALSVQATLLLWLWRKRESPARRVSWLLATIFFGLLAFAVTIALALLLAPMYFGPVEVVG